MFKRNAFDYGEGTELQTQDSDTFIFFKILRITVGSCWFNNQQGFISDIFNLTQLFTQNENRYWRKRPLVPGKEHQ